MITINTVYIDILFLVNLLINTSLLLCLGFILRRPIKTIRLLAGASLGALYSCIAFVGPAGSVTSLAMRFAFAAIIVTTAYGAGGVVSVIKRTLLFVALTIGLGTGMLAVLFFSDMGLRLGGVIKNGVFYFDIPTHYIIFCSLGAYGVLIAAERLVKKSLSRSFARVRLSRLGKEVEFTALVDTGNSLRDPITGKKVIIAQIDTISPLFSFDMRLMFDQDSNVQTLPEGFVLVPYSSIGKKEGLLAAFAPDSVEIDNRPRENILTAVFDGVLSGSGDYDALIGPNV